GLGRRLMEAIEQKAREENCSRLRVECFGNEVGFYQKMGYRIVGQLEDYPMGHSYYWMRKDLQF
ncbi:MAG: GNAT family N-acetyltransferase, partial [Anaerolineae bacterium]|nr:GNAT family N-acetyltransferase [Anaerolineae bacterium]